MTPHDEALERVARLFYEFATCTDLSKGPVALDKNASSFARAAIEAISAGAGPVAWRIRRGTSDTWGYTDTESDADFWLKQSGLGGVKQPLYAASPPPPETREADIRADERKQALAIIERWMKPQSMKLHTGELTAGELRTVLAVLAGLAAAIRARGQS